MRTGRAERYSALRATQSDFGRLGQADEAPAAPARRAEFEPGYHRLLAKAGIDLSELRPKWLNAEFDAQFHDPEFRDLVLERLTETVDSREKVSRSVGVESLLINSRQLATTAGKSAIFADHGVTFQEWSILKLFQDSAEIPRAMVGRQSGLGRSAVRRLLRGLAKKGLLSIAEPAVASAGTGAEGEPPKAALGFKRRKAAKKAKAANAATPAVAARPRVMIGVTERGVEVCRRIAADLGNLVKGEVGVVDAQLNQISVGLAKLMKRRPHRRGARGDRAAKETVEA